MFRCFERIRSSAAIFRCYDLHSVDVLSEAGFETSESKQRQENLVKRKLLPLQDVNEIRSYIHLIIKELL